MKLVIFALLLLSLSACESYTVQPADNSSKNTDTKIENKVKDILDKQTELTDFFKNVVGEDISPILNQIKNAKNVSEQEEALENLKNKVNKKDNTGVAPLIRAIRYNKINIQKILIKAGADVNTVDESNTLGSTPLHWAVYENNLAAVELLLEANSDVNLANKNQHTPLFFVKDEKILKKLLAAGAKIDLLNTNNQSALDTIKNINQAEPEKLQKMIKIFEDAKLANKTEKKENQPFIDFMSTPFTYSYAVPTIGMSTTKQYDGFAPKAPFIADYDGNQVHSYMAIKLLSSFSKNLPDSIKEELSKNNIEENKTDIFLVIQGLSRINSKTQIKAHGWADPDAPYESNAPYDRVKRNFLYGVYESDKDISQDVKINQLKEFEVNTHLNQDKANAPYQIVYSPPQGAIIKIPDDRSNMSFYSLVIDNNNSDKNIRAAVTLHWLLLEELNFQKEIYASSKRGDRKYSSPSGIGSEKDAVEIKKYQNIGQLIKFWQEESFLKDSSLVKKLTDLITDQDK